jgi:dUTP pyrophosphatase
MNTENNNTTDLKYTKCRPGARKPTKGPYQAGYELYSYYSCTVPKNGRARVTTGISFIFPQGVYGHIMSIEPLAWINSVIAHSSTITSTTEVNIVLFNLSDTDYRVNAGDAIAYMICKKPLVLDLKEADLNQTPRQDRGFGSTGLSEKSR